MHYCATDHLIFNHREPANVEGEKNGPGEATDNETSTTPQPQPIDGECGATDHSCDEGLPTNQTDSTEGVASWTCTGSYGGAAVQCPAPTDIDSHIPVCSDGQYETQNSCNQSKPNNSTCYRKGNGCYAWTCLNGYILYNNQCVRPTSTPPQPIDGKCGDKVYSCASGHVANATKSKNSQGWTCKGINGGKDALCIAPASIIDGKCYNKEKYECISPAPSTNRKNVNKGTDGSYYYWHCPGSNGGKTAKNCNIHIPIPTISATPIPIGPTPIPPSIIDGKCNNNKKAKYECLSPAPSTNRQYMNKGKDGHYYYWHCPGSNGGKTARNCNLHIPSFTTPATPTPIGPTPIPPSIVPTPIPINPTPEIVEN